jgi:hypothetical protein
MVRAGGESRLRIGYDGEGIEHVNRCSAGDSRAVKWRPTVNPRHRGDLCSLTNAKVDKQCEMMISSDGIRYCSA